MSEICVCILYGILHARYVWLIFSVLCVYYLCISYTYAYMWRTTPKCAYSYLENIWKYYRWPRTRCISQRFVMEIWGAHLKGNPQHLVVQHRQHVIRIHDVWSITPVGSWIVYPSIKAGFADHFLEKVEAPCVGHTSGDPARTVAADPYASQHGALCRSGTWGDVFRTGTHPGGLSFQVWDFSLLDVSAWDQIEMHRIENCSMNGTVGCFLNQDSVQVSAITG